MLTHLISLVITTSLLFAPAGWIQNQEIKSEQKSALIKEVLALIKYKEKSEKISEEFKREFPPPGNKEIVEMLWKTYPQNPEFKRLNAKQQKALKKHLQDSSTRIGDRYNKEKALLEVSMPEVEDQFFYNAFDKLTVEELKELIAYFRSPTGKKNLEFEFGRSAPVTENESKESMDFLVSPIGKRYTEVLMQAFDELLKSLDEVMKPWVELPIKIADEELKLFLKNRK
jgi:hypothetical protein